MRRTEPPLQARQTDTPTVVNFSTGAPWRANAGDWIITMGEVLVDVVSARDFASRYEPVVEGLTIPKPVCTQLEEVTGVGTTRNPAELLGAVSRLAAICIGEVKIPFTPGQLAELKHRAEKRGKTVEEAIKAVVDRIQDELFFRT